LLEIHIKENNMKKTRLYLLLDLVLAIAFLVEALSGFVLWLVLPHSGGYRGGRGLVTVSEFVFTRTTWLSLHDWFAVVMVAGILLHFALHWKWIVAVCRKLWRDARVSSVRTPSGLETPITPECFD
jgi:hypothetical protein